MSIFVQTPPKVAGVTCPAKQLEWTKTHNCNDCPNQQKCLSVVCDAFGL